MNLFIFRVGPLRWYLSAVIVVAKCKARAPLERSHLAFVELDTWVNRWPFARNNNSKNYATHAIVQLVLV